MGVPLRDQVAIVTGAAGGLGSAVAARLADDGATVVPVDLPATDVTDPDAVAALVAETVGRLGRIDILVNNAGIAGPTAPVVDYPVDAWRAVLEVNLGGVFLCTRACLPHMLERGYGRVVNVSSIAGKDGNAFMSAYSASKAAVIAFTKSVAKEVATSGVLVNCVVPAAIDAGLTDAAPPEERTLFLSRIPMGRLGRADELAELVAWLASPRCSFSTGATFDLTGGRGTY